MTILFENVLYLSNAPGATTKATPADRAKHLWINAVDDFGADPTGGNVAATTAALQAALNAAQGGILYIPTGTYTVNAPLNFPAHTTNTTIMGAGKDNTVITGFVTGYIFNCPASVSFHNFNVISDLSLVNTNRAAGNGCFISAYIDNTATLRDCSFNGFIGVNIGSTGADAGSFGSSIINCNFVSGITTPGADQSASGTQAFPNGCVGAYIGQGAMINCRLVNYHQAICVSEQCGAIIGCSVEVSDVGMVIGQRSDGMRTATGFLVSGFQTERCFKGIIVQSAAACVIMNNAITGQVGTPIDANISNGISGSAVWNGSTSVTVTTFAPHNLPGGTRRLYLQFAGPGQGQGIGFLQQSLDGANINNCTNTGPNTFTFPMTANPGSFTPGTYDPNLGKGGTWNYINITGLEIDGTCQDCTFMSNSFSLSTSGYGVDLNGPSGSVGAQSCVMMNTEAGQGWNPPPALQKTAWQFINCGDQTNIGNNSGPGAVGFVPLFQNLPGQGLSSAQMANAFRGMMFDINDCQITTPGAVAFGTGNPLAPASNVATVRYDGANWRVVMSPNNPTTFANLTTFPSDGAEVNISDGLAANCADGTCTTFGTNVTGGGGALHLKIRWNSLKAHWTLMGV